MNDSVADRVHVDDYLNFKAIKSITPIMINYHTISHQIYLIYQCTLIDRWQKLTIPRLPNKPNILSPILYRICIWHILIQCYLYPLYIILFFNIAGVAVHVVL